MNAPPEPDPQTLEELLEELARNADRAAELLLVNDAERQAALEELAERQALLLAELQPPANRGA